MGERRGAAQRADIGMVQLQLKLITVMSDVAIADCPTAFDALNDAKLAIARARELLSITVRRIKE